MTQEDSAPAGANPAIAKLEALGLKFQLRSCDPEDMDPGLAVEHAVASRLGLDVERVFRTIVALAGGSPVFAMLPATRDLSLTALATAAEAKSAEAVGPNDVERLVGCPSDDVSPIAQAREVPVFLDAACAAHVTVFVSAGRRGELIELSPFDLSGAALADFVEDLGV